MSRRLPILPTSHFVPGESPTGRDRDEDPRGPCDRYEDCLINFVGNAQAHCREADPIPGMPGHTGCRFWEPAQPLHAVDYMAAGGSAGSNDDAERKPHHPPPKNPRARRPVRSARRAA